MSRIGMQMAIAAILLEHYEKGEILIEPDFPTERPMFAETWAYSKHEKEPQTYAKRRAVQKLTLPKHSRSFRKSRR